MDGYTMMKLGHKGFQHMTYFCNVGTLITKKKLMVLLLARNVKPGAGSVQAMQFLC